MCSTSEKKEKMNVKRITTVTILCLSTIFLLACGVSGFGLVRGSGNVIKETRAVSGFDQVEVHGGGNLILVQGDSESLEIEAEDNIMPYLRSQVIGGSLILDFDDTVNKSFNTTRPINYYVTIKDVHGLSISGGGDIESNDIVTDSLEVGISGGGDLKIDNLTADSLQVNVSGGGDVRILSGEVSEQKLHISGGGKYDAADLQSQTVTANVSGGGNLTVWAEKDLTVAISGGGNVYYYGNPALDTSVSGGGDVIRREK
jgi:hypothetical protein